MSFEARSAIRGLVVTPDRQTPVRYAGASGDFNPIHYDDGFARSVGLPGPILHGLWTMAQVARALTDEAGGPQHLRRLRVEFRGMGRVGDEVVVRGAVGERDGAKAVVEIEAVQADTVLIRNGVAELDV